MARRFGISWPYRSRTEYHHHDDRDLTDEWQKEVYEHAANLAHSNDYKNILDVGCGSGFKLVQFFEGFNTLGLELACNLDFLKSKYPQRNWGFSDLQATPDFQPDLVICADVIEHLTDPDELLSFLVRLNAGHIVLSTPDRSLLYRPWQKRYWGPPRNPSHQREWTSREFFRYISDTFEVVEHVITRKDQATQMIVCKPGR